MNYTYSLIINGTETVHSTQLQYGIQYIFIASQIMPDWDIVLMNNETGEMVLAYTPGSCTGSLYVAPSIKEI